jgi:hypothetical protein
MDPKPDYNIYTRPPLQNRQTRTLYLKSHIRTHGITTLPPEIRTLRRSVRIQMRKKSHVKKPIMPWLSDVQYKLGRGEGEKEGERKRKSLLTYLPMELRWEIWKNVVWGNGEGEGEGEGEEVREMGMIERAEIGKRIGLLSAVAPLIRYDMSFLTPFIKTTRLRHDAHLAGLRLPANSTYSPDELATHLRQHALNKRAEASRLAQTTMQDMRARLAVPRSIINEKPIQWKVKKGKSKRKRSNKCWYCEERHHVTDPVCTPARRDGLAWKKVTRVKRKGAPEGAVFIGRRTVFE